MRHDGDAVTAPRSTAADEADEGGPGDQLVRRDQRGTVLSKESETAEGGQDGGRDGHHRLDAGQI